jgi:hypothetical protein
LNLGDFIMANGQITMLSVKTADSIAERKRVFFRPSTSSDVIKVGHLVCYNSDLAADYKERTVNPATAQLGGSGATTYAEGAQTYNARFTVVEKPSSSTNTRHFAGIVAALGPLAGTDGDEIEIVPLKEGVVVPVWTNANCAINTTVLGVANNSYIAQVSTQDGDPLAIGVVVETVDRSNTNGLVWCRLYGNLGIGLEGGFLQPTRALATGDAAGLRLDVSNLFTSSGATGPRTYGIYVTGSRDSDYALDTAGCDDAGIRVSISNYAENGSVYNFRGINVCATNRGGGIVGELDNIISVSTKTDGGSETTVIGLKVDNEHLDNANPTELGGVDIALCREGGTATTEYGLQLRTRGTINSAINSAIRVSKDATDHGFVNLFTIEADGVDYSALAADITWDSGDVKIPIVLGTTTYYLVAWAGS